MKNLILAADLGGTNLRMSAVDGDGSILQRVRRKTPGHSGANEIVELIYSAAQECKEKLGNPASIAGIAVAVPGTVDVSRGIVLDAPNVRSLSGFNITRAVSKALSLPCFLENDANAAAIGENRFGASVGAMTSICVTLGTGVGGGVIIDGKILRGIDGTAGEIGHICVEPTGAKCGCGSIGCLEQYASATALVRMAREMKDDFPETSLVDDELLTSLEIFEAGTRGDELALQVFKKQGFYLGIAFAGLVNVLNPEVLVIGGGASAGWDLFIEEARSIVHQRSYPEPGERARIVRAERGDDAGVLGAAAVAFENLLKLT